MVKLARKDIVDHNVVVCKFCKMTIDRNVLTKDRVLNNYVNIKGVHFQNLHCIDIFSCFSVFLSIKHPIFQYLCEKKFFGFTNCFNLKQFHTSVSSDLISCYKFLYYINYCNNLQLCWASTQYSMYE